MHLFLRCSIVRQWWRSLNIEQFRVQSIGYVGMMNMFEKVRKFGRGISGFHLEFRCKVAKERTNFDAKSVREPMSCEILGQFRACCRFRTRHPKSIVVLDDGIPSWLIGRSFHIY